MAYPTVDKPYGLQPVNLIGGQVYAGSTRLMSIASGYATSIYYGDVVKRVSNGTIEKDTGTSTATPVGIFLGCTYTNPTTSQKTFAQYYPANTAASDIQAYVVDDPDVLFKVATVSSGTTVAFTALLLLVRMLFWYRTQVQTVLVIRLLVSSVLTPQLLRRSLSALLILCLILPTALTAIASSFVSLTHRTWFLRLLAPAILWLLWLPAVMRISTQPAFKE